MGAKKCFYCMEPIRGEHYKMTVRLDFCHDSYFDGVYGRKLDEEKGILYVCKKCWGDEDCMPEGLEICDYCDCYLHEDDAVYYIVEERGDPWPEGPYEVLCRDCYLELLGFSTKRVYEPLDAWRGSYTLEPKVPDVVKVVDFCIVPHPQNDEIISAVEEWLETNGFEHLRYFDRTSNVFSVRLVILAKKNPINEKDRERLHRVSDLFDRYYGYSFSVMSGRTFPIDMEAFKRELRAI